MKRIIPLLLQSPMLGLMSFEMINYYSLMPENSEAIMYLLDKSKFICKFLLLEFFHRNFI